MRGLQAEAWEFRVVACGLRIEVKKHFWDLGCRAHQTPKPVNHNIVWLMFLTSSKLQFDSLDPSTPDFALHIAHQHRRYSADQTWQIGQIRWGLYK